MYPSRARFSSGIEAYASPTFSQATIRSSGDVPASRYLLESKTAASRASWGRAYGSPLGTSSFRDIRDEINCMTPDMRTTRPPWIPPSSSLLLLLLYSQGGTHQGVPSSISYPRFGADSSDTRDNRSGSICESRARRQPSKREAQSSGNVSRWAV